MILDISNLSTKNHILKNLLDLFHFQDMKHVSTWKPNRFHHLTRAFYIVFRKMMDGIRLHCWCPKFNDCVEISISGFDSFYHDDCAFLQYLISNLRKKLSTGTIL